MLRTRKASTFTTTTLDAPMLIRVLEYTREDLSKIEGEDGDLMLHFLADELLSQPGPIGVDRYPEIIDTSEHNFQISKGKPQVPKETSKEPGSGGLFTETQVGERARKGALWAAYDLFQWNKHKADSALCTDRYDALGIPEPNPKTMCKGHCEGTGMVPVDKDNMEEPWHTLWLEAEAEEPTDDGWHFVTCPDCMGTRLAPVRAASIEYERLKAYTKLQNYGSALFVDGILPYGKFKQEIISRPYLAETLLPQATEQTGWDEDKLLHKVYENAKSKVKVLRKKYELPGIVDKAVEAYHSGEGGASWYSGAHIALQQVFGPDADIMADFIAATSPGTRPSENLLHALQAYRQYKEGEPFKGVGSHYGDRGVVGNLYRAVSGEPLSGLKVWNFSRALKGDKDAVVVDMWMARIFLGKSEVKVDGEYLFVEQLIREVAHRLKKEAAEVTPQDVQALAKQGLFSDYPDVQARIWYGVNKKPQSYPETLYTRIQEHKTKNPEFWAPYLEKAQSYAPQQAVASKSGVPMLHRAGVAEKWKYVVTPYDLLEGVKDAEVNILDYSGDYPGEYDHSDASRFTEAWWDVITYSLNNFHKERHLLGEKDASGGFEDEVRYFIKERADKEGFDRLVKSLPKEIYDEYFDLATYAPAYGMEKIQVGWKKPKALDKIILDLETEGKYPDIVETLKAAREGYELVYGPGTDMLLSFIRHERVKPPKTVTPRRGADTQMYAIYGTQRSGVPYMVAGPMPETEAINLLAKNRNGWSEQGYENLTVKPYEAPQGPRTGTKRSRPMSPTPQKSLAALKAHKASSTIERETEEEQQAGHRYNPGLVLVHNNLRIPIGAGTSDRVRVFEEAGMLYVLSTNTGLGYIGLDAFDANTGEEQGGLFLQNDWDVEEIVGKGWEDLSDEELVERLKSFLD